MPALNRPARREWIALAAIVVLAALLRFGWPGLSSFAGDEARISLDALRLTRGGEFVYIAQPSSTGIPFLPASVWMFAPAYLVSPDPQIATWYVSLLSLLCVPLAWALGRRWGAGAGLIAALLLAASPYAVLYGRSIWQPNLLPILGLAWAWTAFLALTASTERRQRIATAANVFLALFVWQVHFAGLPFALGTLYLIVRFRWWRRGLPVLIGAGLAALLTLPYVYYVLTQDTGITSAIGQAGGGAQIDLQALGRLLQLALGWGWGYLALGAVDNLSTWLPEALLAAALLIAGLAALIGWLRRKDVDARPGRLLAEIVLVWLLISPVFFLFHTSPVLPHYLLIALPATALTAGASVTLLPRRIWRWVVTGAALLLAFMWTAPVATSLDDAFEVRPPESALSSVLSESRGAVGALPADLPVLFFGHGDDPAISGEAAVFRTLLWSRPNSRVINGETLLILPPYRAALLATVPPFQAWEELVAAGLSEPSLEFARRQPADPFMAAVYDGETDPQGFVALDPVQLADGVALQGWRVRPVGERLRISTLWRVQETPPEATIQQFHHLYSLGPAADAACVRGETPAVPDWAALADGPPAHSADGPVSAQSWRVGDRLIVMGDVFDAPPGAYALRVGHYSLPDVVRFPRADGSDGAVDVGVFCWPPG
ncbi:MAG TPA: hypothetical protein VER79_04100 [Candidatus Limnocylindrales bacterium]|nr:hypothetical protein [Candidatus Limnocylindrales bacterium]